MPVTIVGLLFISTGIFGLAYHTQELWEPGYSRIEAVTVLLLRVLAIVGGFFLLKGASWARWLVLGWLGYHAVLGAFHSVFEVAVHVAFLLIAGYLLFRTSTSAFFHARRA